MASEPSVLFVTKVSLLEIEIGDTYLGYAYRDELGKLRNVLLKNSFLVEEMLRGKRFPDNGPTLTLLRKPYHHSDAHVVHYLAEHHFVLRSHQENVHKIKLPPKGIGHKAKCFRCYSCDYHLRHTRQTCFQVRYRRIEYIEGFISDFDYWEADFTWVKETSKGNSYLLLYTQKGHREKALSLAWEEHCVKTTSDGTWLFIRR